MNSRGSHIAFQRGAVIVLSITLFLFSIDLIGFSIGSMAGGVASSILGVTSNPFIGLFIGLLSTAILQSSSTTTSITVAAVAAGVISLQSAIPIVLGANIGTTITSTIVSMGYISKSGEFRKAVAAGSLHDFFNILMVLLLFPLEVNYRILEQCSQYITSIFKFSAPAAVTSTKVQFVSLFDNLGDWLIGIIGAFPVLLAGIALLFICIKLISKWLYQILIGKTRNQFQNVVFKTKYRAFSWGLVVTAIAQSSSLTTSLIVPLVATGKVKIKKAFQFILGANIGTTITALLAASFQSEAAINLAIAHLLFNLFGVILFLLVPLVSQVPVFLAKKLGELTLSVRVAGFAYILIAFFAIPFTLIYVSSGFEKDTTPIEEPVSSEIETED